MIQQPFYKYIFIVVHNYVSTTISFHISWRSLYGMLIQPKNKNYTNHTDIQNDENKKKPIA